MAIQMRRGNDADFNPGLLMPGEMAVSQDLQKVYMCFTKGTVIQLAVSDRLNEILEELEEALSTLNTAVTQAQGYANTSQSYAVGTGGVTRPDDDTDNAEYYKGLAETAATNAQQSYTNVQAVIDETIPAFTLDYSTGHLSYALGTT